MTKPDQSLLAEDVLAAFCLPERLHFRGTVWGEGHINDTYALRAVNGRNQDAPAFVIQRINSNVFKDVAALMENFSRVCLHIQSKLKNHPDAHRKCLSLIPAHDGRYFYEDGQGGYWRCMPFISGSRAYSVLDKLDRAYEAAKAFGSFQSHLADLPAPRLHETIPDFHNTPKRFEAFLKAAEDDPYGRAQEVSGVIAFAQERANLARRLAMRGLPERIAHNDTKLNNVLFDAKTDKCLCVIDLDTVMPGLMLHDFGDLVRSAATSAAEDEPDLSKIYFRLDVFEALARGFLMGGAGAISEEEKMLFGVASEVLIFECGLRFLTDYLMGDTYFKIRHPRHNLERACAHFQLLKSLESKKAQVEMLLRKM